MKNRKLKLILRVAGVLAAIVVLAIVAGAYYLHRRFPAEIMPDIRAAIAAKNVAGADNRFRTFLEGRYGSMNDLKNRERAFEGFFNPNHIKAMQIIVKYSPPNQRSSNIQASANWIESYRQGLSPQEKADLGNYFQSEEGRAALQAANAQYMNQDPEYRSATSPVIIQLMTTLAEVKQ